jgi:hypothetical protein
MEGGANRIAKIFRVSQMKHFGCDTQTLIALANVTKNPIVRTNKELLSQLDQYRPASRAYSRINHRNMNRTGWKRRAGGKQRKSCGLNVPGRNIVRDVDEVGGVGGGIAGENYSLNRRDKIVRGAEIGE